MRSSAEQLLIWGWASGWGWWGVEEPAQGEDGLLLGSLGLGVTPQACPQGDNHGWGQACWFALGLLN